MGTERREGFCIECRKDTEYALRKKTISKMIKDNTYDFSVTTAVCMNCGEEMSLPGLIDRNVKEIDVQFREMEVFTQFSSDLDLATKNQLAYGRGLMELLKQPLNKAYSMPEQVITLVAAEAKVMLLVDVPHIADFRQRMLQWFTDVHPEIVDEIRTNKVLTDELKANIIKYATEFRDDYLKTTEAQAK